MRTGLNTLPVIVFYVSPLVLAERTRAFCENIYFRHVYLWCRPAALEIVVWVTRLASE
jgi:hypothetical protein